MSASRDREPSTSAVEPPPQQSRWTRLYLKAISDDFVKSVFDHFRNLGISAVILGAALWKYKHPTPDGGVPMDTILVVVLGLLGLLLFFINQMNALNKLQRAGLKSPAVEVFAIAYMMVAFVIIVSLIAGRV